jgi:hypothetical protein
VAKNMFTLSTKFHDYSIHELFDEVINHKILEGVALVLDVVAFYFGCRIQAGALVFWHGGAFLFNGLGAAFTYIVRPSTIISRPSLSDVEKRQEIKKGHEVDIQEAKKLGKAALEHLSYTAANVVNFILLCNPIIAAVEAIAFGLANSPRFNQKVVEPLLDKYPQLRFRKAPPPSPAQ